MFFIKKKREITTPMTCKKCGKKMQGYEVLLGVICSACFKKIL